MRALPRAARWKRREVNLLELTSGYRSRGNSFVALGVARHLSFSAEGVCLCRWHWDCAWRWKINANHSRFIFIVHLRWCGDNSGPVLMLISPCGDGSVKQGGWLQLPDCLHRVEESLSSSLACLFVFLQLIRASIMFCLSVMKFSSRGVTWRVVFPFIFF